MEKVLQRNRTAFLLLLPLAFVIFLVWISRTPYFLSQSAELSWALTFDLVITVPVVYFLLIRKKAIPNITVVPVFIAEVILASYIVPNDQQELLQIVKTWILPLIEVGVLSYVAYRVRQTVRSFKNESEAEPDFFTAIKNASQEIVPANLSAVFATEIAVFYYGFFSWKKRVLAKNEFSYHKNNSAGTLLGVLFFVILIETFVVHILLQNWNSTVAWTLTILSMYAAIQLFAIIKSFSRRPIVIKDHSLVLRYGLFAETEIPFEKIASFESSSKSMEFDGTTRHLSPLKEADSYNMILTLHEEHRLNGFYGIGRRFQTIAFHVDEKDAFVNAMPNFD